MMGRKHSGQERVAVILGVAWVCVAVCASPCRAADPANPANPADAELSRPILEKLLNAVEANDYDSFVADGTDAVKAALTRQMLTDVSKQLSPRMKGGYEKTYLGNLNQQGCKVYLWKLVFKEGGDDTLAKLAFMEGKIAGFLLQ